MTESSTWINLHIYRHIESTPGKWKCKLYFIFEWTSPLKLDQSNKYRGASLRMKTLLTFFFFEPGCIISKNNHLCYNSLIRVNIDIVTAHNLVYDASLQLYMVREGFLLWLGHSSFPLSCLFNAVDFTTVGYSIFVCAHCFI